jgi:hypothetical protein
MQPRPVVSPAKPGLLERIDAWFDRRRRAAFESYLATSQNVFELEARMREFDRVAAHPYY